jgi:S-disulfanyl-L-cysteine oxidoreductase SoxD
MPKLTDDEVYKLAAYVLYLNKLTGENDVINAETLPKVGIPNKDNFIIKFSARI